MFVKCEMDGVFQSQKNSQKCEICKKDLKFFCLQCESWYYVTYKSNHDKTEKHLENIEKSLKMDQELNSEKEFKLYTYFSNETHSVIISKNDFISSLRDHMKTCLNLNSLSIIKDNKSCDNSQTISFYFKNREFFGVKKEKGFIDYFDELIHQFSGMEVSNERVPLLSHEKEE
jgi:hypothetical protein